MKNAVMEIYHDGVFLIVYYLKKIIIEFIGNSIQVLSKVII